MLVCQACRRILDDDARCCPADGQSLVLLAPGPPLLDGKYSLIRSLDRGGSGLVAAAKHVGLHRLVAVKMLDPGQVHSCEAQARFRVEAEALGRLQHPNIVGVSDFGIDPRAGGTPYLVMELIEGQSLRDLLTRKKRLSIFEALPILEAVAAALDHAHGQGICHRDLKPENVMLGARSESPSRWQVKVVDFGLARLTDSGSEDVEIDPATARLKEPSASEPGRVRLEQRPHAGRTAITAMGTVAGTPGYMAPEVLAGGPAGPPADVYALGVMIYEMLCGRRPFDGDPTTLAVHHLCCDPPPPSEVNGDLPTELDPVIMGAIAKEPAQRSQSAGELVAALAAAALAVEQRRWAMRERPVRLAWAALCVLVALTGTWLLARLGVLEAAEHRMVRACFSLSRPRPPDPRLLLLSMDEATVREDEALLAARADEVGDLMDQVLAAGATAVGIDLLLPDEWSESESFTNLVIEHADSVALAIADRDGSYIGGACLQGPATVVLGPQRAAEVFGIVNVDVDRHGAVYRLRTFFLTEDGSSMPSFAGRMAAIANKRGATPDVGRPWVWIDYSTPPEMISRMSWSNVAATLQQEPERFAGRVVIVGQELTGAGDVYYGLPHPRGSVGQTTGLELQALMVNTLLGDRPIRDLGPIPTACCAVMAAVLLALFLLPAARPARVLWIAGLLDVVSVLAAVGLFLWKGLILAIPALLAPQALLLVVFFSIRGRLRPCPRNLGAQGAAQE